MQFKLFKNKFRRRWRKRQRQVEAMGVQAESVAERYFFKRFDRLADVRRFVIAWLLLLVLLIAVMVGQIRALSGYFQSIQPIPGGIYSEGILGDFTNANPLYAAGEVDESISRLVFASLLTYDDHNRLVGDLADSWNVDATGKVYTVHLRPNLTWQDGAPLTADDVAFTYQMIQNPDAASPLAPSWQGINVKATDGSTVVFTLPSLLASFPYNMTNGIIPKHILGDVAPSALRSTNFNTLNPVGAGPFAWHGVQVSGQTPELRETRVALIPFKEYHGGAPKLSNFVLHAFHDEQQLINSYRRGELTAASFPNVPSELRSDPGIVQNHFLLSAANMVFFKMSNPVFADAAVRHALVQATDVPGIINGLGYPTHPVREPLLEGQLGYDPAYAQPAYNPTAAAAALDAAGWKMGPNGVRTKGGVALRFGLSVLDSDETTGVASKLARDWSAIGVQADVRPQSSADLDRTVGTHDYDALLYGISIGVDPDVFVYWHSSQADPRAANRLNFSEYKSKAADTALEAGRTRSDAAIRIVKYKPFLAAWQQDQPALGLYQPRYLYLTRGTVYGLNQHALNTDADRYDNVQNWMIRQSSLTNR